MNHFCFLIKLKYLALLFFVPALSIILFLNSLFKNGLNNKSKNNKIDSVSFVEKLLNLALM